MKLYKNNCLYKWTFELFGTHLDMTFIRFAWVYSNQEEKIVDFKVSFFIFSQIFEQEGHTLTNALSIKSKFIEISRLNNKCTKFRRFS